MVSKHALQRATLELERRFMGNEDDLLTFKELERNDVSMSWTKRERAAAYLDPRLNLKLAVMTTSEWKVTKNIMKDYFTKFTVTCKAFCRKKMHKFRPQNEIQIIMKQLLTLVEELFLLIVIPATVLMMMMTLMVLVVSEIVKKFNKQQIKQLQS